MTLIGPSTGEKVSLNRALEITIRIGLVLLLIAWCFQIVRPFVIPVVWGLIIAIATFPGYQRLRAAMAGRSGLAATVITTLGLVLLIGPTVLLAGTLVDGAQELAIYLAAGRLPIPPPPASVGAWPIIGAPISAFWSLASVNLEAALAQIGPQLKDVGAWLLSAAAGVGFAILQFVFAIILAGVLLAHADGGQRAAHAIATRLIGEHGPAYAALAQATIRSVARGILGVALIQSLLAGLGFLAVGLPAAGLLALICLLLSVIQVGVTPVVIPAVIYVFSDADPVTAVVFLVWCVFVTATDNLLKPILLGRGLNVPMVVIFVGAIGGFLASGIIGLFVGSVVLALGYTLFLAWLHQAPTADAVDETGADAVDDHAADAVGMRQLEMNDEPL